jgi:hypothetical protein
MALGGLLKSQKAEVKVQKAKVKKGTWNVLTLDFRPWILDRYQPEIWNLDLFDGRRLP